MRCKSVSGSGSLFGLFQSGCNEVVIELRIMKFGSEIILVNSNQTSATRSFAFEIKGMISDQIALHSV